MPAAAIETETLEEQVANRIGDRKLPEETPRKVKGPHFRHDRDDEAAKVIFALHPLPDIDLGRSSGNLLVDGFWDKLRVEPCEQSFSQPFALLLRIVGGRQSDRHYRFRHGLLIMANGSLGMVEC